MKKLKLEPAELEVSSFVLEKQAGGVESMDAATAANTCGCTAPVKCYPSMYCTGTGCVATAEYTCMTASNSPC